MIQDTQFLDFVGVAAPRSGTTWLSAALSEHPEIWMPREKELNFFDEPFLTHLEFRYQRGMSHYRKSFSSAPENRLLGEFTPTYYMDRNSAERIRNSFPNAKIIVSLRNPAEVVFSTYLKVKEYGVASTSFEEEFEKSEELRRLGYFHEYLEPYFQLFPPEKIFVGLYEDLRENPKAYVERVYQFLGVDASYRPAVLDKRINERSVVRSSTLVWLQHQVRRALNTRALMPFKRAITYGGHLDALRTKILELNRKKGDLPSLASETRETLMAMYRDDMEDLRSHLGVDIERWNVSAN